MNPIRDQGYCGSSWAFSAVTALEGAWFIKYGEMLQFSEQQLVDCSTSNNGCDGGKVFFFKIFNSLFNLKSQLIKYFFKI